MSNHPHLLKTLANHLLKTHPALLIEPITRNGKRPDIVYLDELDQIITIELKTRFTTPERAEALQKYFKSCDYLIMAYPRYVDISLWDFPMDPRQDPSFRYCGALKFDHDDYSILRPPRRLPCDPSHRSYMASKLLLQTPTPPPAAA